MKRDASQTPRSVNRGFEDDCVTLPIESILPLRALSKSAKSSRKYRQIVASIVQIGIVEPPIVVRNPDQSATWLLLDGHLRRGLSLGLRGGLRGELGGRGGLRGLGVVLDLQLCLRRRGLHGRREEDLPSGEHQPAEHEREQESFLLFHG